VKDAIYPAKLRIVPKVYGIANLATFPVKRENRSPKERMLMIRPTK